MTDEEIIEIIEIELQQQTLGVTQSYLEIHSPVYSNNKVQIARIDREKRNNYVIAYLPVAGEKFYFAVYINIQEKEITGFHTEGNNVVYFIATSEDLRADDLKLMTKLTPPESWNKGDPKKFGKANYKYSAIAIEPNPEPEEFEDKLKKLLTVLEQDREGVKNLVEKADGVFRLK